MRDKSQTIIITALSILLLVVIAFASGVKMTPPTTPKITPQSQVLPGAPTIPRAAPNQAPLKVQITKPVLTEAQKRAQKINSQCLKMKGVENCSTVVAGNACLIGCKFSKNVKDVNTEKKMIADKVKSLNKSIKSCTVSNSMDAISKVNNLFKNTNQKYINSEIRKIIKEITPITR